MVDLEGVEGFDWDEGNIAKSLVKHHITPEQSEEVFLDPNLVTLDDPEHSSTETRFLTIGKSREGKLLSVVFTLRRHRIRIISARRASHKEQKLYEKTAQTNS